MWTVDWEDGFVVGGDGNRRLTPSFRLKEFRRPDGTVRVHRELVSGLQLLRDRFGKPLSVRSTDADGLGAVVSGEPFDRAGERPPALSGSGGSSKREHAGRRRPVTHTGVRAICRNRSGAGARDSVLGHGGVRDRRRQVPAGHRKFRRRRSVVRARPGQLRHRDARSAVSRVQSGRRSGAARLLHGPGRLRRLAAGDGSADRPSRSSGPTASPRVAAATTSSNRGRAISGPWAASMMFRADHGREHLARLWRQDGARGQGAATA